MRAFLVLGCTIVGCFGSTNVGDRDAGPVHDTSFDAPSFDASSTDSSLPDSSPDTELNRAAEQLRAAIEEAGAAHNEALALCGEDGFSDATAAQILCFAEVVLAVDDVDAVLSWFDEFAAVGHAMGECFMSMGCDRSFGCRLMTIPRAPASWDAADRACIERHR